MNFIRSNKVLFTVFVTTFVLAAVMICFDFYMYSQFDTTASEISQNTEKYDKLAKNNPRPTPRTARQLNHEYQVLAGRLRSAQRRFGKYYRKAFLKFCGEAGLEEDAVLSLFSQFCADLPEEKKMRFNTQTDVPNFLDFMEQQLVPMAAQKIAEQAKRAPQPADQVEARKKVQAALAVFEKEIGLVVPQPVIPTSLTVKKNMPGAKPDAVRKQHESEISRTNGFRLLMAAMGLPLSAGIVDSVKFSQTMHSNIIRRNLIPGLDLQEKKEEYVKKLTFDQLPKQNRIYMMFRQVQVRYDVFRRMKKDGIVSIEEFSITSPLEGESILDGKFLRYNMEGKFIGSMDSIRKIVNDFNTAAAENVLYTVDFLELERVTREDMDSILKEVEGERHNAAQNNPGEGGEQKAEKGAAVTAEVVVGKDNMIRLTMKFHTVIYVGDEIARVGAEQK